MKTLLEERVIDLEAMMADLIETFKRRDREWEKKLEEEKKERERRLEEERKEREKDREEWNKKWGELARKMGTIAEDIIATGTEMAIKKRFNTDVKYLYVRAKGKIGALRDEFDIIVETDDNKVFMIEVKSTPRSSDIKDIIEKLKRFKKIFPKYEGKVIIPVFASLYIPENIINCATKKGVYVMGLKGEFVEFLN